MGNNITDTRTDKQQIYDKVFPNKNHTTRVVECLRLRPTVQIPYYARSRLPKYGNRFPLPSGTVSQGKSSIEVTRRHPNVAIDVKLQYTDVADEEQLFFLPDGEEESEQEIFVRKALSNQRAIDDHEKDLSTKVTVVDIPLNSAIFTFRAIKENARIRNEQDADLLLKALKLRLLHEKNMTTISLKRNHGGETYSATKKE